MSKDYLISYVLIGCNLHYLADAARNNSEKIQLHVSSENVVLKSVLTTALKLIH